MAGCDNNCDAVAGLNEAAANLIQYSNLIESWLYGGADQTVDIGGVSTPTLLNLAMSIKQLVGVWPDGLTIRLSPDKKIYVPLDPNGGVKVGSNGLYTDFSDLPQDKLDDILKSLRLPIWLTANTNFYVDTNSAAASDTLDNGRGLSASKPFKTIQAAIEYVTANYNLATYNATISIAAGTYNETLTLRNYQTSGGRIIIQGAATYTVSLTGGISAPKAGAYNIKYITFDTVEKVGANNISHILVSNNASVIWLFSCEFSPIESTKPKFALWIVGGSVTIYESCVWKGTYNSLWLAQNGASITLNRNTAVSNMVVTSSFLTCESASVFTRAGESSSNLATISGIATGRRYNALTNSIINVRSAGPEFFPGTVAGTTSTGGQYL